MASVTKAMAAPESGLEVRDRMWLKITIPNAFLGMAGAWEGSMEGGGGRVSQSWEWPRQVRQESEESLRPFSLLGDSRLRCG